MGGTTKRSHFFQPPVFRRAETFVKNQV
jgi:hypothetical protein